MPEREFALKVVGVAYDCDECGEKMERDGNIMLATSPPLFSHKCRNGHTATLPICYPTTGYRRVAKPDERLALMARAILELAEKAAYEVWNDNEPTVGTGVLLSDEAALRKIGVGDGRAE